MNKPSPERILATLAKILENRHDVKINYIIKEVGHSAKHP